MTTNEPDSAVNRLLISLPRSERHRLLADCAEVELAGMDTLAEQGGRLRHVHFPVSAAISLTMPVHGCRGAEVGLVGEEGMLGAYLALGVDLSPVRALVRGGGRALRMDAAAFRRALPGSPALRRLLQRYLYVMLGQFAHAIACARFHRLDERLARRLLMADDRSRGRGFAATHESLAAVLGVRRVGVTESAAALQERGLIHYRRGDVTIVDRRGLEAAACACYAADLALYARTMAGPAGPLRTDNAGGRSAA